MTRLLVKDPSKRMGHIAGADEVKMHPWFHGIRWALVRNSVPPFIPKHATTVTTAMYDTKGTGGPPVPPAPEISGF